MSAAQVAPPTLHGNHMIEMVGDARGAKLAFSSLDDASPRARRLHRPRRIAPNRFAAVSSKSRTIWDGKCSEIAALTVSPSNRMFCNKPVHRLSAGEEAEAAQERELSEDKGQKNHNHVPATEHSRPQQTTVWRKLIAGERSVRI